MDTNHESPLRPEVPGEAEQLGQTENLLRQFAPAPVNIDRERLMFLAGRAAAEARLSVAETPVVAKTKGDYRRFLWPAVAACLAIALAVQYTRPPRERVVVREVLVPQAALSRLVAEVPEQPLSPVPQPRPTTAQSIATGLKPEVERNVSQNIPLALPTSSVLQMRNVALRFGVDALPATPNTTSLPVAAPSPFGWQELQQVELEVKPAL